MYRNIPGQKKILGREHNLTDDTDEDQDGVMVDDSNWPTDDSQRHAVVSQHYNTYLLFGRSTKLPTMQDRVFYPRSAPEAAPMVSCSSSKPPTPSDFC